YALVPSLLFVAVLSVGTTAAWRKGQRALGSAGAVSMLALLVASIVHFRTPENVRDPATSWTRQMSEARAACQAPSQAEHVFRISPTPWMVGVPCSLMRSGGPGSGAIAR
ncbi:MAG TPA: hypothetical protein VFZ61_19270, partial [Polyangiales bacterium]